MKHLVFFFANKLWWKSLQYSSSAKTTILSIQAFMSLQILKNTYICIRCLNVHVFGHIETVCECVKEGSTYILSTINAGDSPSDDVCKRKFRVVVVNGKDMIIEKKIFWQKTNFTRTRSTASKIIYQYILFLRPKLNLLK